MVNRVELITLHIMDLLELLGTDPGGEGTLVLLVDGEERAEMDLADLCLCLKIDVANHPAESGPEVIPFSPS